MTRHTSDVVSCPMLLAGLCDAFFSCSGRKVFEANENLKKMKYVKIYKTQACSSGPSSTQVLPAKLAADKRVLDEEDLENVARCARQ